MIYLYINILFFISISFVILNIKYNTIKYLYSYSSLCGGILGDLPYNVLQNTCHLPCNARNSFNILSFQNNSHCSKSYISISIKANEIISDSNMTVYQHKIINKKYFKYEKHLVVYCYILI